ncbi:hypothetical protein SDC9_132323 [bioreactor metagenome]|uniref:Uncharacterized protein n=1 Tax=bioreactor metagenome TaxID=1076179 RepID=A0A645D7Q8_9ZZZZ
MTLPQEFEGVWVINGDVVQVQINAMTFTDEVTGTLHDGEGRKPQEVHFEQAHLIHNVHLELGDGLDGRIFRAASRSVQRGILYQGDIGNDHAGSMGACVAHHAFHLGGGIDEVA